MGFVDDECKNQSRTYGCVRSMQAGKVLTAFKANATRKLREAGCWKSNDSPWADRRSKKYLWTEQDVVNAIAYVEYDQGEPLP